MNFEVGKVYNGFKLIQEEEIKEINSVSRLFYHEKSGARLLSLLNDDDNKVFSISFRTPPHDSTGVPHILEHSVLCGSRKFPVKEPFVELAKGSLNTFLNAMTFADKTMYPVASKNEKDFYNLMDVYLDAALYPNIYKQPEILMQEGWHYELDNPEDEITYKGVVYNEMKGAFSSPEGVLMRKIQESLFPDTTYGFESGGDPDVIPELTQENFTAFHKKYYHPSNSYIFLYGNGNLAEQLKFIDEGYLKDFDKIQVDSEIKTQAPFNGLSEKVVEYPISPSEKEEDKTFLSLNMVTGKATDPELYLAFDILEHFLLETPAAPLKKALIDAELGQDVFGSFDSSILQPVFSIVVKNSNDNRKEEFQKVVFDTLRSLVNQGIDKKLIEASINVREFALREADYHGFPTGLLYNIKCMDSWLYDDNPDAHLKFEDSLNKIKSALNTKYFEELIERYLLDNPHSSLLIVKPKRGFAEERAEELKNQLSEYKSRLSKEEIEKIIENTRRLKERQESPDTKEDLESIPLLSLKDINPESEKLQLEEKEEEGVKVLAHHMFTNNINYMDLYFDTSSVEIEKLPYITLLARILGNISTEKYDYRDLANEININTGGIRFSAEAYAENGNDEVFYPKFVVRTKALTDKTSRLMELVGEIIGHTRFDDEKRVREVVREIKSRLEMTVFDQGHIVAQNRALSYFSPIGRYMETLSGFEFYWFIVDIEKNYNEKRGEIKKTLEEISKKIFNKNNLMISVTTAEENYNNFKNNLSKLYNNLDSSNLTSSVYKFDFSNKNEGLMTSGKVQYVAKAYNMRRLGYQYTGQMQVLKSVASLDYLWNKVRVQGGAYGSFIRIDRNGNVAFSSYRDPNLKETLSVYNNTDKYLKSFEADEREMTKYIIGTFSKIDFPLTPSMKGQRSAVNYITHVNQEDIQREREQVLNTTQEDIRKFSTMLSDIMKQDYICVLGSEDKIKANSELFDNLINVFE